MKSLHLGRIAFYACLVAPLLGGCAFPLGPSKGQDGMQPTADRTGVSPLYYRVLHSFGGGTDGKDPYANLINVNGTLYGTTAMGGAHCHSNSSGGCGTVFSISPGGTEQVLYSFRGGSDGEFPAAALLNVNGVLYGTTVKGGANCGKGVSCGTVYSITMAGKEKVVHRFTGQPDGGFPWGSLIYVQGTLYGTTARGGTYKLGTVFSLTETGTETVLHSFSGTQNRDGSLPYAGLIDVRGTLYGTTNGGGKSNGGTVFSISTTGEEHVLHSFKVGRRGDGANPYASLIDANGTLTGTTLSGGATYCCGAIFGVTTAGKERVLHSFHTTDGTNPYAGLIYLNSRLYGTTTSGGEFGYGTVFSMSKTHNVLVLHNFSAGGTDGTVPNASLLDVNGMLYGTTTGGGAYSSKGGGGTVFALTP